MEFCRICTLQYKRDKKNHELTNTHLAVITQNFCQHCERIINLADKTSHLQSKEHEIMRNSGFLKYVKRI